ncbi:MAG: glutamine--tRNA ligase, partial [Trueperaceae bacterium]
VRGVLHWVAQHAAARAEFRLLDRLFADPDPEAGGRDVLDGVDPDSLQVRHGWVEPHVAEADPDARWQFERQGYFWRDPVDGRGERLVFTRIVTLKDRRKEGPTAHEADPSRPASSARPPAGKPGDAPDPLTGLSDPQLVAVRRLEGAGVPRADAARIVPDDASLALFDAAHATGRATPDGLAGWLVNELPRALDGAPLREAHLRPDALAELVALVEADTISGTVAKELLAELVQRGGDPAAIVRERSLSKLDDDATLDATVDRVLDAHPDEVRAYLDGKSGLIGFFVGQVMRATGGRADPKAARASAERRIAARR